MKAKCSRKCAVPLFFTFSALEPASTNIPTVAEDVLGMYSVAIVNPLGSLEVLVPGICEEIVLKSLRVLRNLDAVL